MSLGMNDTKAACSNYHGAPGSIVVRLFINFMVLMLGHHENFVMDLYKRPSLGKITRVSSEMRV